MELLTRKGLSIGFTFHFVAEANPMDNVGCIAGGKPTSNQEKEFGERNRILIQYYFFPSTFSISLDH